ncbi:uncharacterized protein [Parasteatoda tepidariorum]|uniref:uncharacterized protein n=1 Tax=Parasteatoda tepidariorum TaxID=114398 RepID=UPI001C71EAC5|nr:uncharacterized protein LOC107447787 [Parasteatoda tepidariorum]
MASCSLLVVFLLGVNLLLLVSASSGINSDVSEIPVNDVTEGSLKVEALPTIISNCDCGTGSIACVKVGEQKVCLCEDGRAQRGDTCEVVVSAGWRTGGIILIVLFIITLLGFGFFVYKSRQ